MHINKTLQNKINVFIFYSYTVGTGYLSIKTFNDLLFENTAYFPNVQFIL